MFPLMHNFCKPFGSYTGITYTIEITLFFLIKFCGFTLAVLSYYFFGGLNYYFPCVYG